MPRAQRNGERRTEVSQGLPTAAARLILTRAQCDRMVAHVHAGLPNEACGLLGGVGEVVRGVYPIENVAASPVRYTMDPVAQVRAMVAIENEGWQLLGIFHSHPTGPPHPSPTDIAQAYYPDSVYVICAPDGRGEWRVKGFNLSGGAVAAVPLLVGEGASKTWGSACKQLHVIHE
ncbi:MAG: M67 family metallopeptidase, partial [Anaerolineales bacterium]